jgi:hypothetical protein
MISSRSSARWADLKVHGESDGARAPMIVMGLRSDAPCPPLSMSGDCAGYPNDFEPSGLEGRAVIFTSNLNSGKSAILGSSGSAQRIRVQSFSQERHGGAPAFAHRGSPPQPLISRRSRAAGARAHRGRPFGRARAAKELRKSCRTFTQSGSAGHDAQSSGYRELFEVLEVIQGITTRWAACDAMMGKSCKCGRRPVNFIKKSRITKRFPLCSGISTSTTASRGRRKATYRRPSILICCHARSGLGSSRWTDRYRRRRNVSRIYAPLKGSHDRLTEAIERKKGADAEALARQHAHNFLLRVSRYTTENVADQSDPTRLILRSIGLLAVNWDLIRSSA